MATNPESAETNALQEIGEFEFLPMSNAFRTLVHEHWNKKTIQYQSVEPFAADRSAIVEALSVALSDGQNAVGPIHLAATQTKDWLHGEGSMRINGFHISISLDDLHTSLTVDSGFGPATETTIPTDRFSLMLLDIAGSNGRIGEEDKIEVFNQSSTAPEFLRSALAKMVMLNGKYQCTTRTTFNSPPEVAYIADLIDGETPSNSSSVLNIYLSHLYESKPASAEELDSHQKAMLVRPQDMDIVDQHVTITPEGAITPDDFILAKELGLETNAQSFRSQPENNFSEWLMVCRTFNRYIQPLLKPYAHLDEYIDAEPVDFTDPDFRKAFPEF